MTADDQAPLEKSPLRRSLLGLDRAVVFVLLDRFWTLLSSAVTLLMVVKLLSPAQQGFFTQFRNLLALRVMFELGLAYVVVQVTSHEASSLHLDGDILHGEENALKRVSSLLRLSVRWYAYAAALFFALVLPAGMWLFSRDSASTSVGWQGPWLLAVFTTSGIVLLAPMLALNEGLGLVSEVALFRFVTGFIGAWLVWLLIAKGMALYGGAALLLPELAAGALYVFSYRRKLVTQIWHAFDKEVGVAWKEEVLPFQWRIAASWLAGYMQFQIIGTIVFFFRGSVASGQVNVSLNLLAAVSAVSMAWIGTKAPKMGRLIAQRKFDDLDKLFFPALYQVGFVSLAVAASLAGGVWWLHASGNPVGARVISPSWFLCLSLGILCNSIVTGMAIYLRAHKKEPLLVQSVVVAILMTLLTGGLAWSLGADYVAGAYLLAMAVSLIWTSFIFATKRNEWHSALP